MGRLEDLDRDASPASKLGFCEPCNRFCHSPSTTRSYDGFGRKILDDRSHGIQPKWAGRRGDA
jgi:hypothetical protein